MGKKHQARSKKEVSYNMSRIKGKNTKIERLLGSAMHSLGLRYRKQYAVAGRPDFAFPRQKVAVFCDSGFWHGREWDRAKGEIRTNREFWLHKIERNIARDREVNVILTAAGWMVIRFWDDQITENPITCAMIVQDTVISRESLQTKR